MVRADALDCVHGHVEGLARAQLCEKYARIDRGDDAEFGGEVECGLLPYGFEIQGRSIN